MSESKGRMDDSESAGSLGAAGSMEPIICGEAGDSVSVVSVVSARVVRQGDKREKDCVEGNVS